MIDDSGGLLILDLRPQGPFWFLLPGGGDGDKSFMFLAGGVVYTEWKVGGLRPPM